MAAPHIAPLLRAPSTSLSFLLPAFAPTIRTSGWSYRSFSSNTVLRAAPKSADSEPKTNAGNQRPNSIEAISNELSGILNPREVSKDRNSRSRNVRQGDEIRANQDTIARRMNLDHFNDSIWGGDRKQHFADLPPPPVRLDAFVGRGHKVSDAMGGLLGTIRAVEAGLNRNGVRREARQQRFHERPGMKRKRLRSERWRKRFKEGFQATVARVDKMRRSGW